MKILFLELDGVMRVPADWSEETDGLDYCPDVMRRVSWIVAATGAMLVIASDRHGPDELDVFSQDTSPCLPAEIFHPDWCAPAVAGIRWKGIDKWLLQHQEVMRYAILDRNPSVYEGAPAEMIERLVICPDAGLTAPILPVVSTLLNAIE